MKIKILIKSIIYIVGFVPMLKILNFFLILRYAFKKKNGKPTLEKMGLVNLEFFHKDAGGFGGYGKSAKNVADYFNNNGEFMRVEILLSGIYKKPELRYLNDTTVIFAPPVKSTSVLDIVKYARTINERGFSLIMTIEYYQGYKQALSFLPRTPLIIWIHDPRTIQNLEAIATVSLELLACGKKTPEELIAGMYHKRKSITKLIKMSRHFKRKVLFATTATSLIARAQDVYNIELNSTVFLPTPVAIPKLNNISFSNKPSVCFLARLDPIKRPWIFFELAKRMKNINFLVAGKTHFPKIMGPIIEKYQSIPNLKFLGFLDENMKEELLKNIWVVVNTSIHEALPVSFLESFSYGKPIVSCHNPDNFARRFGRFTGELTGEGFDANTINIFAETLSEFINRKNEIVEKGVAAREFVTEYYSFPRFKQSIEDILKEFKKE